MKKDELLRAEEEEHKAFHRRLIYVFILIMLVLFGGAMIYSRIEGWRYLDALYLSAATMTTVGYGDITPKTDLGKLFTIVYVFVGVGIALYGLSLMASHFVEVREEFWLEKIKGIRIRHPRSWWEKIANLFTYKPDELVKGYEKSSKRK